MPIYEYVCQSCGKACELLIRGSETPQCPHCRASALEKQFSVPAAHTGASGGELPVCQPGGT